MCDCCRCVCYDGGMFFFLRFLNLGSWDMSLSQKPIWTKIKLLWYRMKNSMTWGLNENHAQRNTWVQEHRHSEHFPKSDWKCYLHRCTRVLPPSLRACFLRDLGPMVLQRDYVDVNRENVLQWIGITRSSDPSLFLAVIGSGLTPSWALFLQRLGVTRASDPPVPWVTGFLSFRAV